MVGGWTRWTVIQCLLVLSLDPGGTNAQNCGNNCMRAQADLAIAYQSLFDLIKTIERVQKFQDFPNDKHPPTVGRSRRQTGETSFSNSTVFIIDNNLAPSTGTQAEQTAELIKLMTQMVAFTTPVESDSKSGNIVFMDTDRAWVCDGYKMLGKCQVYDVLQRDFNPTVRTDHEPDVVSAACSAGLEALGNDPTDFGYFTNPTVVAFTSNPLKLTDDDDDKDRNCKHCPNRFLNTLQEHEDAFLDDFEHNDIIKPNNNCVDTFDKRAAVAITPRSRRRKKEVKQEIKQSVQEFSSPNTMSSFIHDFDEDLLTAARNVVECYYQECCGDAEPAGEQGECDEFIP